jgi:type IV secretion system protein VirB9
MISRIFLSQSPLLLALIVGISAASAAAATQQRPRPTHTATVRAANEAATVEPAGADFVNAGAVYAFSDNAIYRLYTAPGRVTDIALQPGERLVSVASGDTVRWIIGDTSSGAGTERRVHVLVKPVAARLSTNLLIATDRRTYHLALTSSAGPAMAALSWSYPEDALLAIRSAQAAEASAPVATGLSVERLNFAYTITGDDPAWRPLRAFDDGRQTFIEFPRSIAVGEAPPLFLVDGQDDVSLVNYRVQGRFYVVDRLFAAAELRLGGKRQAVVRITRGSHAGRRSRGGKRR